MLKKDTHCSYCGTRFEPAAQYPKACDVCKNVTFINPLPVAAILLPIKNQDDFGVLTIRRAIPPFIGSLALPGGYLSLGETWQEGAARELFEETGIRISPNDIRIWGLETVPSNSNLLIFCGPDPIDIKDLPDFVPNDEVSEMVVVYQPIELAFPTHTKYLQICFDWKDM